MGSASANELPYDGRTCNHKPDPTAYHAFVAVTGVPLRWNPQAPGFEYSLLIGAATPAAYAAPGTTGNLHQKRLTMRCGYSRSAVDVKRGTTCRRTAPLTVES